MGTIGSLSWEPLAKALFPASWGRDARGRAEAFKMQDTEAAQRWHEDRTIPWERR